MSDLYAAAAKDDPEAFTHCRIPEEYRAAVVLAEEQTTFADTPADQPRDVRRTLHIRNVPTPHPEVGEVLIATMASSINYNTVWTARFQPMSSFRFLRSLGKTTPTVARHDQPYHVVGSDAAGVILEVGAGVHRWKPGDEVVVHNLYTDPENPEGHDDDLLDPSQRAWGYETNFGGLAELSLVRSTQLMPKPAHLTWEEAASYALVATTAYRQLVSRNGAAMKQGDRVLIWGACGGLGAFATQLVLGGGGIPICVVSTEHKAELCRRMGAELVIDRTKLGTSFWDDEGRPNVGSWSRLRTAVRKLAGGDPEIVFEHPGRDTFGASVFVAGRGGSIVTCASTTGYDHHFDNRHLWMNVKRVIGTHSANYREAAAANDLVVRAWIHPVLSQVYPLEDVGQAAQVVNTNQNLGKVGVLCLAPTEGLGVRDALAREKHIEKIMTFRSPDVRIR